MADETTTTPAATSAPTGPATPPATDTGAGTSAPAKAAHKPKADPATLPGGAKFDAEGASSEDFDKHFEILSRRAKLAGLATAAPGAQTAVEAPAPAAPAKPNPGDIRTMNKAGEERYFDPITWAVLGDEKGGWEETVEKPADLK